MTSPLRHRDALASYLGVLNETDRRLEREDILAPRTYGRLRELLLPTLLAHKRPRRLPLHDFASLVFESRFTAWFQVQEELRFHPDPGPRCVAEILERVNPLVAPAGELRATLLFEGGHVGLRRRAARRLPQCLLVLDGRAFRAESLDPAIDEGLPPVSFLRFAPSGRALGACRLTWPALDLQISLAAPTRRALSRSPNAAQIAQSAASGSSIASKGSARTTASPWWLSTSV